MISANDVDDARSVIFHALISILLVFSRSLLHDRWRVLVRAENGLVKRIRRETSPVRVEAWAWLSSARVVNRGRRCCQKDNDIPSSPLSPSSLVDRWQTNLSFINTYFFRDESREVPGGFIKTIFISQISRRQIKKDLSNLPEMCERTREIAQSYCEH